MISFETYARVNNKSSEQVFNWWLNPDSEKYRKWFPDHIQITYTHQEHRLVYVIGYDRIDFVQSRYHY